MKDVRRSLLGALAVLSLFCVAQPADATCFLRQSTASQVVWLPTFVDSTDGDTAETGLTIANTDIKLSKAGGTTQTNKNSGGATHVATGDYYTTLDATDTNTVGLLKIKVKVSGALAVWLDCQVVEEAVYDALFAASAPGYVANAPVNVAQFGGSNGTFASGRPEVNVSHFGGTAGTFASGRPETNMTHIAGSAVSTSTAQLGVNVVNFGGSAGTFASGRPEVNTTHWTGSSLTTGTGPLPGLGILDRGDLQSDSTTTNQIRSAATFADSELVGATNLLYSATTGAGQRCMVSANVSSTDTLTCSNTLATDPTGTVRYELYGTGAGSAGGSLTASDVWTYGTRSLTILDEDSTTIDLNASYVGGVTVFDEDLTTMDINATTIGTVTTLTNAPSDSSGVTTLLSRVGTPTNLGSGATLSANAVDIESQTDDIGVAGAGLTAADDATLAAIATVSGYVDTEVAAILDDTGTSGVVVASGSKTGYSLSSTGLNAITLGEPSGKPSWSSSNITEFLAWLIAPTRNKVTQTSTTKTIRNDADNANIVQCSVSDDGTTFTLSECSP